MVYIASDAIACEVLFKTDDLTWTVCYSMTRLK